MAIVAGSIKPRFAIGCLMAAIVAAVIGLLRFPFLPGYYSFAIVGGAIWGGFWIFAMRRKDRAPLGIVGWGVVVMLQMLAKRIFFGPKAPVSDNHAWVFMAIAATIGIGVALFYFKRATRADVDRSV